MKQKTFLTIAVSAISTLVITIGVAGYVLADSNESKKQHSTTQVDAEDPNLLSRGETDNFEIIGYGELQIDKDYPNINLINSSENNVYLSFDVFYNDEVIYQTNLISPGQMEQYDIYSKLDAGQHTLTYSINVYDLNENILWSGIQQKQDILITN